MFFTNSIIIAFIHFLHKLFNPSISALRIFGMVICLGLSIVLGIVFYYCNQIKCLEHTITFNDISNRNAIQDIDICMRLDLKNGNSELMPIDRLSYIDLHLNDKDSLANNYDKYRFNDIIGLFKRKCNELNVPFLTDTQSIYEYNFNSRILNSYTISDERFTSTEKHSIYSEKSKKVYFNDPSKEYRLVHGYLLLDSALHAFRLKYSNENIRIGYWNCFDISQFYLKFKIKSNIKVNQLTIDMMAGSTEFSNMYPVPDLTSLCKVTYTNPEKIQYIKKHGLLLYAKIADSENQQYTKMILISSALSICFTLFVDLLISIISAKIRVLRLRRKKEPIKHNTQNIEDQSTEPLNEE